ncbi:hypothetical protein AAEU23_004718 [Escherichia coli]
MRQQQGLALLEVVIFLILISLGYIGWMNIRKNVSEFDYAMQMSRSLCYYKEHLIKYIKSNPTKNGKVTFSDLGISNSSGYPSFYPEYKFDFYANSGAAYIIVSAYNNNNTNFMHYYLTRMVLNSSVGFLSTSLFPFNGRPENINIFNDKNSDISSLKDYFTLKNINLSNYRPEEVIAVVLIPKIISPYQECYYGF